MGLFSKKKSPSPEHVSEPVNPGKPTEIRGEAPKESMPHVAATTLAAQLKEEEASLKAQKEAHEHNKKLAKEAARENERLQKEEIKQKQQELKEIKKANKEAAKS